MATAFVRGNESWTGPSSPSTYRRFDTYLLTIKCSHSMLLHPFILDKESIGLKLGFGESFIGDEPDEGL